MTKSSPPWNSHFEKSKYRIKKMGNQKFEAWLESKTHIRGRLHPIEEEFTRDTTLAVFLLNPETVIGNPSDNVLAILRDRGYTRLYILYLFSRIGDFSELMHMEGEKLIDERSNPIIDEIIPDAAKIFFAYGEPPNQKAVDLIDSRVEEVKQRMWNINPDYSFYRFGELSDNGYPKRLNDLQSDDIESELEL